MKYTADMLIHKQKESTVIENSTPRRMQISSFFSSIAGILLMAVMGYYVVMAVFICILISIIITDRLFYAKKISIETACLLPLLILCFVYTPVSWFTFDGLSGCTPYLTILFCIIIILTYYTKIQNYILSFYLILIFGLTLHWVIISTNHSNIKQVCNNVAAYFITILLTICILQAVKEKNIQINQRMKELSTHDELTHLLNRRALTDLLTEAENTFLKDGIEYALVLLDINQFKSINDLYGHSLGDSALQNFASCIQQCLRASDYAFRLGGDEFLLLLPNVTQATTAEICNYINQSLSEIRGYSFSLTTSMGYALRSEVSSVASAMELADQRMYEEKKHMS